MKQKKLKMRLLRADNDGFWWMEGELFAVFEDEIRIYLFYFINKKCITFLLYFFDNYKYLL